MRSMSSRAAFLLLGLDLASACGSSEPPLFSEAPAVADALTGQDPGQDPSPTTPRRSSSPFAFPGAGSSGAAQPLSGGLGPESSRACDPSPPIGALTETPVQHVCFFAEGAPAQPAALIEQLVERVGTGEWLHLRLTLNPDLVDNTYGSTALGWSDGETHQPELQTPPLDEPLGEAEGAEPPALPPQDEATPPPSAPVGAGAAPPAPGGARPPPPADGKPPRGAAPPGPADAGPPAEDAPRGAAPAADDAGPPEQTQSPAEPGGHTFSDLVGEHAELQLLDASGKVALELWLDYLSPSGSAPSGYASLGVSGGAGRLTIGAPAWVLATTSSMDRNLNACGLGSFTSESPETDPTYRPNPAASAWDYRVSYEAWISSEAFGDVGFGSARIQLVQASPSKRGADSLKVTPAPCPDPEQGELPAEPLPPVLSTSR